MDSSNFDSFLHFAEDRCRSIRAVSPHSASTVATWVFSDACYIQSSTSPHVCSRCECCATCRRAKERNWSLHFRQNVGQVLAFSVPIASSSSSSLSSSSRSSLSSSPSSFASSSAIHLCTYTCFARSRDRERRCAVSGVRASEDKIDFEKFAEKIWGLMHPPQQATTGAEECSTQDSLKQKRPIYVGAAQLNAKRRAQSRNCVHHIVNFSLLEILTPFCVCDSALEGSTSCVGRSLLHSALSSVRAMYGCVGCGEIHYCRPSHACVFESIGCKVCPITTEPLPYTGWSTSSANDVRIAFQAAGIWLRHNNSQLKPVNDMHACDLNCTAKRVLYKVFSDDHLCVADVCIRHASAWMHAQDFGDVVRKIERERRSASPDIADGMELWVCVASGRAHLCVGEPCDAAIKVPYLKSSKFICPFSRLTTETRTSSLEEMYTGPETGNMIEWRISMRKRSADQGIAQIDRQLKDGIAKLETRSCEELQLLLENRPQGLNLRGKRQNLRSIPNLRRCYDRVMLGFQLVVAVLLSDERFKEDYVHNAQVERAAVEESRQILLSSRDSVSGVYTQMLASIELRICELMGAAVSGQSVDGCRALNLRPILMLHHDHKLSVVSYTAEWIARIWTVTAQFKKPKKRFDLCAVSLACVGLLTSGLTIRRDLTSERIVILRSDPLWRLIGHSHGLHLFASGEERRSKLAKAIQAAMTWITQAMSMAFEEQKMDAARLENGTWPIDESSFGFLQ